MSGVEMGKDQQRTSHQNRTWFVGVMVLYLSSLSSLGYTYWYRHYNGHSICFHKSLVWKWQSVMNIQRSVHLWKDEFSVTEIQRKEILRDIAINNGNLNFKCLNGWLGDLRGAESKERKVHNEQWQCSHRKACMTHSLATQRQIIGQSCSPLDFFIHFCLQYSLNLIYLLYALNVTKLFS